MRDADARAVAKWSPIARRVSLPGLYRLLARAVRHAARARSVGARAYKVTAADCLRKELDKRLLGDRRP